MANILIAGDSWGIGVFEDDGVNGYAATGQGIHTHLEAQGHQITNISKGGGANWHMIDRLQGIWDGGVPDDKIDKREKFTWDQIDHVVFFQTDVFREHHYYGPQTPNHNDTKWKILRQDFVNSLLNYDSLQQFVDDYFYDFYIKLNEIGQKNNKKILCIGGWNQLHPSIMNYPNLIPVVYSSTKLLLPQLKQDVYLSDPEWYSQMDANPEIMNKFGAELKPMAIYNAEKLELLYNNWHDVHPTLEGYGQIADVLVKYF